MQKILIIIFITFSFQLFAQEIEKIDIPKRVVYKYCKPKLYEEAKKLLTKELSNKRTYSLIDKVIFIGPVLWNRYKNVEKLSNIEGGKMTLLVDDKQLIGKLTQNIEDGKKVWDQICEEVKSDFKLRKATYAELDYYWTVISFDIEEPLIIIETSKHRYIININPKTMDLLWIDEAP